ncbi:uncharacterized protein LOC130673470, partial [Microplitis mediator]|uniref:uncharacterized protein LOC130673470 n=1 Tax=Microplitis mediator TaxID=375433 RepID=UPI002557ACE4
KFKFLFVDSNKYNSGQGNSQTPANDFYNNQNYFQDIFMEHSKPLELEFGHVFETPSKWEQRFEKNDIENKRFQGKVRWGNNEGSYGEHYWDLNHRK